MEKLSKNQVVNYTAPTYTQSHRFLTTVVTPTILGANSLLIGLVARHIDNQFIREAYNCLFINILICLAMHLYQIHISFQRRVALSRQEPRVRYLHYLDLVLRESPLTSEGVAAIRNNLILFDTQIQPPRSTLRNLTTTHTFVPKLVIVLVFLVVYSFAVLRHVAELATVLAPLSLFPAFTTILAIRANNINVHDPHLHGHQHVRTKYAQPAIGCAYADSCTASAGHYPVLARDLQTYNSHKSGVHGPFIRVGDYTWHRVNSTGLDVTDIPPYDLVGLATVDPSIFRSTSFLSLREAIRWE